MTKNILYIFFIGLIFIQCSPKTTMVAHTNTDNKSDDAWRSTPPGPGEAREVHLGNYTSFDLDNGLKVIVVENHKLPRVSYQISLNHNPPLEGDQVGYISVAGDLLGRGTTTKTKAEIDQAVDFIGARLNTFSTGIFASSLKKHSKKLLDIMTDVLYHPAFPEDQFEKIKTQTLSGLATRKSDPQAMVENVASVLNFGKNHPYGEVTTEESVKKIKLENCKSYYDKYFKANNAYLIIVGDITPQEAKRQAKEYFSNWQSGSIPKNEYQIPTGPKTRNVAFANKDGAVQSVVRITYPVDIKPGDEDLLKARVMNNILGGGIFSGRLMQNLREDKAYTYGARSRISADRLGGTFRAYASVRNEVTDSSITEFLYEMNRMRNEPVSAENLQLVKNSMAGSFARSLESPQTIARFARNIFRFNLPKDYYDTYLKRLDKVSIEDVTAMAKKYIHPDQAYIIVSGSKDDVADKLRRFDSDGKIDFYDAYGRKLDDGKIKIPDGVDAKTVISDYISAIGGEQKLKGVKTMLSHMESEMMGQKMNMEVAHKGNDKYYMSISMMGNVIQEMTYDGKKVKMSAMGQSQVLESGPQVDNLKKEAVLFDQLNYFDGGYTLTLKGIEDVDGHQAYKIEVKDKNGNKSYEYYDVKSSLLVQSTNQEDGPNGKKVDIINKFRDYKDVDGVMMPFEVEVSGAMPTPIVMKFLSIKTNVPIEDSKFKVE